MAGDDDDEIYEIDELLKYNARTGMFLVSWEGFPSEQNTWEPAGNLPDWLKEEYFAKMRRCKGNQRAADPTRQQQQGGDVESSTPSEARWLSDATATVPPAMAQSDEIHEMGADPNLLISWAAAQTNAFSAICEFLDNAGDAFATLCKVAYVAGEFISFLDNGRGMDLAGLKKFFMFAHSSSADGRTGQYGQGAKSGAMKLGGTMLVLTRSANDPDVQVACLMSSKMQRDLKEKGTDEIIIPTVTMTRSTKGSGGWGKLLESTGKRDLELILKYSRHHTEAQLTKAFAALGKSSGTLIEITDLRGGLWRIDNDDDILLVEPGLEGGLPKRVDGKWLHDVSLRAFLATVYARLPEEMLPRKVREATPMEIVLQGRKVVPKDWEQVLAHVEKRELVLSGEALAPMRRVLKKTTGKETTTVLLGFTEPLDQKPGQVRKLARHSENNVQGFCMGATSGSHCRMIGASPRELFDSGANFLRQNLQSRFSPDECAAKGCGVVCLLVLPKDDGHQATGLRATTDKIGFIDNGIEGRVFQEIRDLAADKVGKWAKSCVTREEVKARARRKAEAAEKKRERELKKLELEERRAAKREKQDRIAAEAAALGGWSTAFGGVPKKTAADASKQQAGKQTKPLEAEEEEVEEEEEEEEVEAMVVDREQDVPADDEEAMEISTRSMPLVQDPSTGRFSVQLGPLSHTAWRLFAGLVPYRRALHDIPFERPNQAATKQAYWYSRAARDAIQIARDAWSFKGSSARSAIELVGFASGSPSYERVNADLRQILSLKPDGGPVLLQTSPPVKVVPVDAEDPRVDLRGQSMLVATAPIPVHAVIGIYTGRFWREDEFEQERERSPGVKITHERYTFKIKHGGEIWLIDPYPGGESPEERFGNELQAANCPKGDAGAQNNAIFRQVLVHGFPIIIVQAVRDIPKAGTEILVDYGEEHMIGVDNIAWLNPGTERVNRPCLAGVKRQLDALVASFDGKKKELTTPVGQGRAKKKCKVAAAGRRGTGNNKTARKQEGGSAAARRSVINLHVPVVHCEACMKDVRRDNWARHCRTKSHREASLLKV